MQSSQVNSFLDIFSGKKTKKDFTNAIKCSLGFGTEHVFTVRSTVWLYSIHKIKHKKHKTVRATSFPAGLMLMVS